MTRRDFWLRAVFSAVVQLPLVVATFFGGAYYERHFLRPEREVRMRKIPCGKGVPCREIVLDTAWMQVVEVKP